MGSEYKVKCPVEEMTREKMEEIHGELLKRYDFYIIRSLDYLMNKNNMRIVHLTDEKVYVVITGREFKKTMKRKLNKWQKNNEFLYADRK